MRQRTCAALFCAARLLVDSSLLPLRASGLRPSSPALSPLMPYCCEAPALWSY